MSFQQMVLGQLDIQTQKMNLDTDRTSVTKVNHRPEHKMQNYTALKMTLLKDLKDKPKTQSKYLKNAYLIKDLYTQYIRNH